jgi:hypothetical protein
VLYQTKTSGQLLLKRGHSLVPWVQIPIYENFTIQVGRSPMKLIWFVMKKFIVSNIGKLFTYDSHQRMVVQIGGLVQLKG